MFERILLNEVLNICLLYTPENEWCYPVCFVKKHKGFHNSRLLFLLRRANTLGKEKTEGRKLKETGSPLL